MTELKKLHELVQYSADELEAGRISRREFVRNACLMGASFSVAWNIASKISGGGSGMAYAQTPKMGGNLRCSMSVQEMSDPATFDWTEKSNVGRQVMEYLTQTDEIGITHPVLCTKWQASPDLKTWTLKLREGVKFNNGQEFNADDVVYNIKRWLDSRVGSSMQSLLDAMITTSDTGKKDANGNPVMTKAMTSGAVEKTDSHTVIIHLSRPEIIIPEILSQYPAAIVDRHFDDEGGDISKRPVGTGPYTLAEFEVGTKAVLKKRPPADYWGKEVYLDQITYIDHGDESMVGISALISNQVDMIYELAVENAPLIERYPEISIHGMPSSRTCVARMQVDSPPFDNLQLRRAIRLCQDRQRLIDISYGSVPEITQIAGDYHVAPSQPDYFPLANPKQDIPLARQLVKDAGYPDGVDVEIAIRKSPPWELACMQGFAEMCKEANIRMKLNVMPNAQYWEIWNKAPFGFTNWGHRPLGVMTLNLAYRGGAPWNETHYNNPEVNQLLDRASGILDNKERSKVIGKIEKIIQEDSIIAQPLWQPAMLASRNYVKGFEVHPFLFHNFNNTWLA